MAETTIYQGVSSGNIAVLRDLPYLEVRDCEALPAEVHTGGTSIISNQKVTGGFNLSRGFICFPTLVLGPLASVSQAVLYIRPRLRAISPRESDVGQVTTYFVRGSQHTPLQASDFHAHVAAIDSVGSVTFAEATSEPEESEPWFHFDVPTDWVNVIGYTHFCLLVAGDKNAEEPTGYNRIGWCNPNIVEYKARLEITYTILPPVVIPTITTNPATAISQVSATLNNILNDDGGEACDCGFQWGLTPAYGHTTLTESKVTGESSSRAIHGLFPGFTYHFRAFATNSAGTGHGADMSFTSTPIFSRAHALSREEL
ncbi:hypothetical protein ES706_04886 [subsurface metagenome]